MWNESDIIANEMYILESDSSEEEASASTDSKFVMEPRSASEIKRDGFIFAWRIENFSSFGRKTGEYIQSPTFLVEKLDKTEWYLRLYPRGDVDQDYIACYLYRKKTDNGPEKISIGYIISFVTVDGSPSLSGQVDKLTFEKNKGFGNTKFKKREDLFKKMKIYLPKDTLTIRCHMWKCFFEKSMAKECFACTRIDVERCFLTWSIKNFSACESGLKQDVPFIPASTKIPPLNIKWYLQGEDGTIHIDIIHHGKKVQTTTYVNCAISLNDSKGNRQVVNQSDHFFEALREEQIWNLPPLIEKSKLLSSKELYLPEDTLSLSCEMAISLGEETSVIGESNFKPSTAHNSDKDINNTNTLKKDLFSLYSEKRFCDVTLRATNKTFQAHKAILSYRSAVFRSMIENDKFEENGSIINMQDVDEITLNDMLVYIYSETLDHLRLENAIKLYCAADKYQVPSLKNVCCQFLKSVLSVGNVCIVLALADEHKDSDMKIFIQEFICSNSSEVFHSKQWKDFMERKTTLAAEIMHQALKKN